MKFIGQERLIRELNLLLAEMRDGTNFNILFRGKSGHGKTTLGLICANILGLENFEYYVAEKEGLNYEFSTHKRIHFVDEIHLLQNPEFLYPILDSEQYCFFFASNESGTLKEPLLNRCISLIFQDYTKEELKEIVKGNLYKKDFTDKMIEEIYLRTRQTPRTIKVVCQRLNVLTMRGIVPNNVEELKHLFEHYLGIYELGLTDFDKKYLSYLEGIGGRAGFTTMINGVGLDKGTIQEIEKYLLSIGKIQITPRGRILT